MTQALAPATEAVPSNVDAAQITSVPAHHTLMEGWSAWLAILLTVAYFGIAWLASSLISVNLTTLLGLIFTMICAWLVYDDRKRTHMARGWELGALLASFIGLFFYLLVRNSRGLQEG